MTAQITQSITALPDNPDPATDSPTVFSTKAAASVLAQMGLPTELNAFATQANALSTEVNSEATSAAADAASAAVDAASAAASAASAILSTSTNMTSVTSLAIPTSGLPVTKVFTTQAGKAVGAGMTFKATSDSSPTNWMLGSCTYSGTTLTMSVTTSSGSGTFTDWTITLSGPVSTTTNNSVSSKSSSFTAYLNDKGSVFNCTATLTVTLDAAATLGNSWYCYVVNDSSSGTITVDPNASETITGPAGSALTTLTISKGVTVLILVDGTNVRFHRVGSARPYLKVSDQKASGTAGGTSVSADITQTRTLNTTDTNTIAGASLSSNTITLPAGTYYCRFRAPAYNTTGSHKAFLYNSADSTYTLIGSSASTPTSSSGVTDSVGCGSFTITASKTFTLRHYTTTGTATSGLGAQVTSGQVEVYAELEFWQEAQ